MKGRVVPNDKSATIFKISYANTKGDVPTIYGQDDVLLSVSVSDELA